MNFVSGFDPDSGQLSLRLSLGDVGILGPTILTSSRLADVFDAVRTWIEEELTVCLDDAAELPENLG